MELEAQNQLTFAGFTLNDRHVNYQKWNDHILSLKENSYLFRLWQEQKIAPFQDQHTGIDAVVLHSVQYDILGALMENTYMRSGHSAFFFLELLMVYEAGHFPCGWVGDWPQGKLIVY